MSDSCERKCRRSLAAPLIVFAEPLEQRVLFDFEAVSTSVLVTEGLPAAPVIRLHLTSAPASSFVASLTRISGDSNIIVTDNSVTFDANNWRADKYIRLQATADADATAGVATIRVSGGGLPTLDITATEKDDDVPQAIELGGATLNVPEGRTATARVRLVAKPASNVIVTTLPTGGDADLSVEAHGSLTFTSTNWDTWQWVSFAAKSDADTTNGSATFDVSSPGLTSQTITVTEQDLGNPITPIVYETTIDDYVQLPLQGQSSWGVDRLGGDRGVIGAPANVVFGRGYVDVTGSGNGVYSSLSHVGAEQVPVNLQALLPSQIQSTYQYRATGIVVKIASGTGTFRMELKDASNAVIWSFEATLIGGPRTLAVSLPSNLGNAQYFNWLLTGGAVGQNVRVQKVTMNVSGPKVGYVEDFLWPYATLLANYDPTSGLTRDVSTNRAGEFDGINGTGALAAATAYAAQLGVISNASAQQIVSTIAARLISLQSTASFNGVIAHFVKKSGSTFIPYTGSEYSSIDTTIALLYTLLASQALGLPTSGLQQAINNVNWDSLLLGNGVVSFGFNPNGTLINGGWDWFGTESLMVALAFASAKGHLPAIPNVNPANPQTANGSGFIDEMLWGVVPVVGHDAWNVDWDIYRTRAAVAQIDHYDDGPAPVFGASAGEVPIYSLVNSGNTYHAYGIGTDDGSGVFAAPVAMPHYGGMMWSLFPSDAKRMFDYFAQAGMLSPLNMVESAVVQTWSGQVENAWSSLKGSWNTGLWSIGAGRALLAGVNVNPLFDAAKANAFVSAGYQLIRSASQNMNIGNATVVLDQQRTYDSVAVGGAGNLIVRNGGLNTLRTAGLTVNIGGTIDLADNDVILDYTGGSPLAMIESLIGSARNGGNWLGAGLTSSVARDNPGHNTTLGAMEASDYRGFYGAGASFAGQTPGASSVLVKYTYYGDANFSGTVTFDDYVRIDTGFNAHLTGWSNGDFNQSGGVNFDDYVLIDTAFNTQSGPLNKSSLVTTRPPTRRDATTEASDRNRNRLRNG